MISEASRQIAARRPAETQTATTTIAPATTAAATGRAGDEFADANTTTEPATTVPATKAAATAPALPEIHMPPGEPWTLRLGTKGVQMTMWAPEGWEKQAPTDKSPPMFFKQGKDNNTHRATWYFVIVELKEEKTEKVLDRAILGRTTKTKDFKIRDQKTFKRADGKEVSTLLFTYTDAKGAMIASRETYGWVDAEHLVITFEWAQVSSWRECHWDMEAMTAALKVTQIPLTPATMSFTPEPTTGPAKTLPDSAMPLLPPKH